MLARLDPKRAAKAIKSAFVSADGALDGAAGILGVSTRTLKRLVAELVRSGYDLGPRRGPGSPPRRPGPK